MRFHFLFALCIGISMPAFAQQTPQQLAEAELPSLLTIYKGIHTHPELSTQEQRTAALLAKELKAVGCDVTENVGKYESADQKCYGVVGLMKNGDGPVVLVRTDLDALPVQEETGLPYASKVTAKNEKGDEVHVMHACGHDAHVSMLIGVARSLAKLKDQWRGTIVFVGQPAEELGTGARAMLRDGLYTRWPKPNYALGVHDTPAMYNNPELTKQLVAAWKKTLGDPNVEMVDATMGGEDFSEYSLLPEHSIPAVNFHVGAVEPAKLAESKKPGAAPLPTLHSSRFAPVPEPTIRTGVVAMTAAVLDLMKK